MKMSFRTQSEKYEVRQLPWRFNHTDYSFDDGELRIASETRTAATLISIPRPFVFFCLLFILLPYDLLTLHSDAETSYFK